MVVKISSKHQITIPKDIADAFRLKRGDVLEIVRRGDKIIMVPKEVILEDKYSQEDLEAAEEVLSRGLPKEEIAFKSGPAMERFFKKRSKK